MTTRRVGQEGRFDSQADGLGYRLIERVAPNTWVIEITDDGPNAADRARWGTPSAVGTRMTVKFVSRAQYDRHF